VSTQRFLGPNLTQIGENFHNLRFSQIPKMCKKAQIGKISPKPQMGAKEVNRVGQPPKPTAPFRGSSHNTQRKFKEAQFVFF
jgi:hypothetical protein